MSIRGRKVTLRPIEHVDLPQIQNWSNDPEIQFLLAGWHLPSSMVDMEDWFAAIQHDPTSVRLAVETDSHGLIGTASLVDINWKDRNAYHGLLLGNRDSRGKGFGTDAAMTVMRFAFEELGLVRLDGSIIEHNEASIRLYLGKCGWQREGLKKGWYWRRNRSWDKIIVGITRAQYEALAEETGYWA